MALAPSSTHGKLFRKKGSITHLVVIKKCPSYTMLHCLILVRKQTTSLSDFRANAAFAKHSLRGGGGGGGGGVHPDFFVKLDFEIAVGQQPRAHDQTFEGVPDSGCLPVPAGQPRQYLINFCQITLTSQPCFGVLYL